jgi:hypothetical protein
MVGANSFERKKFWYFIANVSVLELPRRSLRFSVRHLYVKKIENK